MCGVCGIVSHDSPPDLTLLRRMMGRLGHRGPDGNGYFRDRRAALGTPGSPSSTHRAAPSRSATRTAPCG